MALVMMALSLGGNASAWFSWVLTGTTLDIVIYLVPVLRYAFLNFTDISDLLSAFPSFSSLSFCSQ